MTEITVKLRWPQLILAILLGPALASPFLLMATLIFPPIAFFGILIVLSGLMLGYMSYLILAGPLMILAQKFGFTDPLIHAGIGLGAVWLIPAADTMGIPLIATPDVVGFGQLFGPAWCAVAAAFYPFLCCKFSPNPEAA